MSDSKPLHMSPEEFRRQGHAVVDWIADYYSRIETLPVLSRVPPGEIRANLPKHPPQQGVDLVELLAGRQRGGGGRRGQRRAPPWVVRGVRPGSTAYSNPNPGPE